MTIVNVCLGSACYARVNDKILAFLEDYIAKHKDKMQLELVGCRCRNLCADGPNIFIGETRYSRPKTEELKHILENMHGQ